MELADKIERLKNLINSAYTFEKLLDALREYSKGKGLYNDKKCKYKMSNEQEIKKAIGKIRRRFKACKDKYGRDCCYGVYIIRCIKDSQSIVLYIGKGGTVNDCGRYSKQGVFGRIPNVKNKNTKSIEWFSKLLGKHGCKSLEVEILCFDLYQDRPQLFAPGFIEALLLQYYLWENKKLPPENNEL